MAWREKLGETLTSRYADCVRAVVPHMPPGGRIINISSVSSKICLQNIPFYSAAKAAVDSLTLTWAGEV